MLEKKHENQSGLAEAPPHYQGHRERLRERFRVAGADALSDCDPIYEEIPGWTQSTVGITRYEDLPANARNYLKRIEQACGVPVDMISTGPDRNETIVLRHPFKQG